MQALALAMRTSSRVTWTPALARPAAERTASRTGHTGDAGCTELAHTDILPKGALVKLTVLSLHWQHWPKAAFVAIRHLERPYEARLAQDVVLDKHGKRQEE